MHAAILLWGLTGVLGKLITLNELPLVWWRMFITAIILGVALKLTGKMEAFNIRKLKPVIVSGIILAFHWIFFFASIKYANISIALSTLASTAMFTSLIQAVLNRRAPFGREMLAALVTIVGVGVVLQFQSLHLWGIVFGMISAFLGSLFTIRTKQLLAFHTPYNLLFVQLVGGVAIISLIVPIYLMNNPEAVVLPTGIDWLWLLILSAACTAYAMKLSYDSLEYVSAFVLNLSTNLEPVYSILLAFWLFKEHEQLNHGFWLGALLIFVSLLIGSIDFGKMGLRTKKVKVKRQP